MPLLGAVLFSLWAFGLGQLTLEQPEISVSRPKDKSAHISCKVSSKNFNEEYIYWYRQKPDQGLEHLTFVVSGVSAPVSFGGKRNKLEASKNSLTSTSTLKINFLEKEDEAVYYCACWIFIHNVRVAKITYTRTIFRSLATHILLNVNNHRGCTTGHPAKPPSLKNLNYTSGDLPITQVITSITKKKGNTAFLECQIKKNVLKKNVCIHWYQQKPDKPLKRILYISSNENVVHEQDGETKMRISQDQLSFTRRLDRTVHISCKLSGVPLQNAIVHWYQQKEGEPLTRILHGSTKNYKQDKPNSRLETDQKDNGIFYLIINNVVKSDEATYYCACWDLTMSHSHKGPGQRQCLLTGLRPEQSGSEVKMEIVWACFHWVLVGQQLLCTQSSTELLLQFLFPLIQVLFNAYCLGGKQIFRPIYPKKAYEISDAIKSIFKDFKRNPENWVASTVFSLLVTSRCLGEGRDFCRSCDQCDKSGWIKKFSEGTKLIVTTSDKTFHSDNFPKPTIFLPSIAEINLHKVGTHLCLLEKFFPDVIKIYWKEKDRDTVLESQQGRTMKNNDTYMKFSWLTVTAKSMDKEHKCIVKHENNKGGVDQEILFPSIKKALRVLKPSHYTTRELPLSFLVEATAADGSTACVEDKRGTLQLQLTNTSAYYTYLLLLFKSGVYFAIIAFCLFRRTAVCGNGKS